MHEGILDQMQELLKDEIKNCGIDPFDFEGKVRRSKKLKGKSKKVWRLLRLDCTQGKLASLVAMTSL